MKTKLKSTQVGRGMRYIGMRSLAKCSKCLVDLSRHAPLSRAHAADSQFDFPDDTCGSLKAQIRSFHLPLAGCSLLNSREFVENLLCKPVRLITI